MGTGCCAQLGAGPCNAWVQLGSQLEFHQCFGLQIVPRFRPILEVLNPDTLKPNGLKAVALDLGGGKLGGSSDNIQIIVKNGSEFTAPASDGLTRPDGDTGSYLCGLAATETCTRR